MVSLGRFERPAHCLEVIQYAWFLLTLRLNYCFVSILILASTTPFWQQYFEIISAKLVPTIFLAKRTAQV